MPEEPQHIVALIPNWLGDVVMCTPALRALHRKFPSATLTVVGRRSACDMLRGLEWIHRFEIIGARPGMLDMLRGGRRLRYAGRDLAVVFPHSFRAALMSRVIGSRRRVGYARNGRNRLLTHLVEPYREGGVITPIYMAREYLDLLAPLGCDDDGEGLELAASPRAVAGVKEHLVGKGPFVGIAPGAAFGPSKRWDPERYAEVADRLHDTTGAQGILITGPGEEDTRDAVLTAAKHRLAVCDEGFPTIDTLKATVSQLDLLIGNDSGPRHVAVAFHVPTICIMGPTKPASSVGPYELGRVLRVAVDCGPCQKPVCATDHRCMTRISTDTVVETAQHYLRKAPRLA